MTSSSIANYLSYSHTSKGGRGRRAQREKESVRNSEKIKIKTKVPLHSSHCLKFFIYGGVLGNVPSFTLTCQLMWSLSLYRQTYHLRVHGSNTLALSTRSCYATVFHSLGSCKCFAPPQCSSALGVWIVTERCSEYKTRGYAQRLQRWICQLTECRWHFKSVTP